MEIIQESFLLKYLKTITFDTRCEERLEKLDCSLIIKEIAHKTQQVITKVLCSKCVLQVVYWR